MPESLLASSSPKEKRLALPKAASATFAFAPCLMSGDGVGGRGRPGGRGSGQRSGDDAPSIAILFASRVVAKEEEAREYRTRFKGSS